MDIVDYDIIKNDNKTLIFLKIIDETETLGKLVYKTLNNVIYETSSGFCVTDKKGTPLIIRDDLNSCQDFLNEEFMKNFNVIKKIKIHSDET